MSNLISGQRRLDNLNFQLWMVPLIYKEFLLTHYKSENGKWLVYQLINFPLIMLLFVTIVIDGLLLSIHKAKLTNGLNNNINNLTLYVSNLPVKTTKEWLKIQ